MTIANISTLSLNIQTMSSREIAELTGKRHDNVMSDIRIMLESLEIQSPDFLGDYKDSKGRTYPQFNLPKRETLILVSGYNVRLRAAIIDRWEYLEKVAVEKVAHEESRLESKFEFKGLAKAISEDHEELKPYHFSNELDLINRIALGMTASKFRKHHDINKNESIRDYMSKAQLDCISDLQRVNTIYIEDGHSFQDRKELLVQRFNRRHKDKLIEEIKLIES